ncbi:MAG: ABC transporter ATP-binding protein [bacterium]|nr:ABC transporter ATP-binding protein [bacterium]
MTAIGLNGLVLERQGFRLGPISLELASGSRTALVGPSGSGKSTLLRCIAGLDEPSSGEVRFGGECVSGGRRRSVPPDQRGIGFVFQRGALWPHMTAVQHLRFVEPSIDRDRALELLHRVGLGRELAERRPHALSGGEAQRLALARALAPAPSVLLLDEPLASVDAHLRAELALLVRRLAEDGGLTLVVVTHDREEALTMADRIAVLNEGRLVDHGEAAAMLRAPATAATAAFLNRATCLAVEANGNGGVSTPFGDGPRPAGDGPWSLVLLPGDLEPAREAGVMARVLRCEPDAVGYRVHAAFDGHSVEFGSSNSIRPGDEVRLAPRGALRILPREGGRSV